MVYIVSGKIGNRKLWPTHKKAGYVPGDRK